MEEVVSKILLNKNRGWRGLAELVCYSDSMRAEHRSIFSFSQDMWDDLMNGLIVIQDEDCFYILKFEDKTGLPKPTQQRSVLIKNFETTITNMYVYKKTTWQDEAVGDNYVAIKDFIMNRNNHTKSDWNCIGIRVIPRI